MGFVVSPEAYGRYMGRYAEPLAEVFGAFCGVSGTVHAIDPDADDQGLVSGAPRGYLTDVFRAAGLSDVQEELIAVDVVHPSFAEWWEPYTYGVGVAGDYVQRLDDKARTQLEMVARQRLGAGPFTVTAAARAVRGRVSRPN